MCYFNELGVLLMKQFRTYYWRRQNEAKMCPDAIAKNCSFLSKHNRSHFSHDKNKKGAHNGLLFFFQYLNLFTGQYFWQIFLWGFYRLQTVCWHIFILLLEPILSTFPVTFFIVCCDPFVSRLLLVESSHFYEWLMLQMCHLRVFFHWVKRSHQR